MNRLVQPAGKHTKTEMHVKTLYMQVDFQAYLCDQAKTLAAKGCFYASFL